MKPVLQALVLADRVYQDVSGKKVICGTFSGYKFSKKPPLAEITRPDGQKQQVLVGGMRAGSPCVYISLTDVCDGTKIQVQFVSLSRNTVLFGKEIEIPNDDRLRNVEIAMPLPELPITEAGTFAVEVLCEGSLLGSWRILAEDLDATREGESRGSNSA